MKTQTRTEVLELALSSLKFGLLQMQAVGTKESQERYKDAIEYFEKHFINLEPVAWRPAFDYDGYEIEGNWNNSKPTEKDLEFWGTTKVGIEYAYKLKETV